MALSTFSFQTQKFSYIHDSLWDNNCKIEFFLLVLSTNKMGKRSGKNTSPSPVFEREKNFLTLNRDPWFTLDCNCKIENSPPCSSTKSKSWLIKPVSNKWPTTCKTARGVSASWPEFLSFCSRKNCIYLKFGVNSLWEVMQARSNSPQKIMHTILFKNHSNIFSFL